MTKKLLWIVAVLCLAGCGDDNKGKDKGITLPDKGPGAEGPVTKKDNGVTPDQPVTKQDTGGGPVAGLGAKCSSTKACPNTSVVCQGTSETTAFCTKECPVADFKTNADCSGAPAGTKFICAMGDNATNPTKAYCLFLCQAKSTTGQTLTWPCPTELTCGTPDAQGFAVCG